MSKPVVFFDVAADGKPLGRIVMEVNKSIVRVVLQTRPVLGNGPKLGVLIRDICFPIKGLLPIEYWDVKACYCVAFDKIRDCSNRPNCYQKMK